MAMRQTTSMKPLGAALLSLVLFSICTANAEETTTTTRTFSTTRLTPSSSDSVTTVNTVNSSTSISVTSNVTLVTSKVSQTTSLQQSAQVTTSPPSTTATRDETNSTGKAESPPGSSVTRASNSPWIMTDLNTSKTTSGHSTGHEIISSTDGSSTAPRIRISPTGTHAETISPHLKPLSTPTSLGSSGSNDKRAENDHYSGIILPVVIALIVITLSVFILVALYRMCRRTTPERQENGAEQAPTDKEGVKLLSVKTTSPETGEHSSLGKNKTRQYDESSSHLGNKYM